MKLHAPFSISARLMPALVVGGATISLEIGPTPTRDGRARYIGWIDLPDGSEHEVTDLASGVGGGTLQRGFASLCCFLSAAAESRMYRERSNRKGENEDLFPPAVVEWACSCSDELSMLECDLEETPNLLEEG